MKIKYLSETSMLIALMATLLACLLPVFNSGMIGMIVHSLLIILFVAFATFFWRETPKDERDITHQMFAGRVAFFVGVALLLGWMVYQVYIMQTADPVLVMIIVVMVSAKILAHSYSQRNC